MAPIGSRVSVRKRLRAASGLVPVLALGAGLAGPARAQTVAPVAVDIPMQELNSALLRLAQQTDVQIAFDPVRLQGRLSPAVSGRLTPAEAMRQLLAGSGYDVRFTGTRTATLVPVQSAPAAVAAAAELDPNALPPVDVQATAWRSWQPIKGYVAPVTTTGAKTDTPLIQAPQSVGVVTRDQIDDQQPQTVSQALRYTAGVQPEVRPSPRYDSVFVRGFGGAGTAAAFVNFQDGLRQQRGISYAIPSVDPFLLERIEVLRGPASVLYGQTGAGGIVNLVSRRPTEEPIREIRLEGGSYGRIQTGIDFGGKLTEDGKLLYRVTGIARQSDSQYNFVEERRFAIAPALTWKPTEDTSITLLTSYQKEPEGGFYNFVPASGTVIDNRNGRLHSNFFGGDPAYDHFRREQGSVGYQFEHRINDIFTVRQNYRYQTINSDFQALSIQSLAANGRTANRVVTKALDNANTSALDNQLQATVNTGPLRHTLLGGVEWDHVNAERKLAQVNAGPTLDLFAPTYNRAFATPVLTNASITTQKQDQVGVYAQDQVDLGKLRLNFGVRHDNADASTFTRATRVTQKQSDNAFTWRVGGLYLFDSGVAPYANYSTSFLPNAGTNAPQRGATPFKPTTGDQYEVGIKYQPPGMQSFVQLAAYQITQQNVLTRDPVYTTYTLPTGEIRSRGVELEVRANLSQNIDLIGAYSYIDATIEKTNTAGVTPGNRVPAVPHHLVSGWANYRVTSGTFEGLSFGGGVRYISQTYGDEANSFRVPGFTLFDAAIRWDLSHFGGYLKGKEVTLNANNLLDREYISSCSSTTACYFGNRRLVLAGLRVKW